MIATGDRRWSMTSGAAEVTGITTVMSDDPAAVR